MFAAWLTDALERREMTRAELARRVDVHRSAVSQWCAGITTPDRDTYILIGTNLALSDTEWRVADDAYLGRESA